MRTAAKVNITRSTAIPNYEDVRTDRSGTMKEVGPIDLLVTIQMDPMTIEDDMRVSLLGKYERSDRY